MFVCHLMLLCIDTCHSLSLQESDEPSEKETKEKSPSDSSSDDYGKDVVCFPLYLDYKAITICRLSYI